MCTAITFRGKDHYFGRNLDVAYSFGETVTITPRNFPLPFRCAEAMQTHYALIGMALVEDGYPLYFDATNEHGLSMAGLDFPGNAIYCNLKENADNITPFELIPWILGQCKTISDAKRLLKRLNVLDQQFNAKHPLTPMHWMLADKECSIVAEPLADGVRIYENPVGVLTNNPPFFYHQWNIQNYLNLTSGEPENRFSKELEMIPCSHGLGAYGLPGDLSSPSRFVRAAFVKANSAEKDTEPASISQFFHILGSVEQQEGCAATTDGWNKTVYASCCNTDQLIYYYHTYTNRQITAIRMTPEHMQSREIIRYPLITTEQIRLQN